MLGYLVVLIRIQQNHSSFNNINILSDLKLLY
uniref:Uncharacterized protein n=1 Tax=Mammaliicoccus phage MSShimriz1 TaxID=3230127 RepID=A0AAU8GUQ5_9VIRU